MRINVHAGHNPDGKLGAGAVGINPESTLNRYVADELITMLREAGHTVYDCTVNDGANAQDVMIKIVQKCNAHNVDLDISIHHNICVNDYNGNGKTTGTEVLIYPGDAYTSGIGRKVCEQMEHIGYTNRGVKQRSDLYFLNRTKAHAMLIECCFIDDKDDMNIWDEQHIAQAIMYAVTGDIVPVVDPKPIETGKWYKIHGGAYKNRANAERALAILKENGYSDFYIQEY